jgi:hypothetical protein
VRTLLLAISLAIRGVADRADLQYLLCFETGEDFRSFVRESVQPNGRCCCKRRNTSLTIQEELSPT